MLAPLSIHKGPSQAIYIHWPFCKAKCPYCDFNSHVRASIEEDRWSAALCQELHWAAQTYGTAPVHSIFFGGGTPSLMAPRTVQQVIDTIQTLWPVSPQVEITLEANPTSAAYDHFRALKLAGVNRLSIGIQSLEEDALRFLGRQHSVSEAISALEAAQKVFTRYSFDLIYTRPGQTVALWEAELRRALALAGGHLSLYQLTIEEGTGFYSAHRRGDWQLPDDDTSGALYECTQDILTAAGMPAYEISNHARPGEECRHNLTYWRYEDYMGIGPGAHGRVTVDSKKLSTRCIRTPEAWLTAVETQGHGLAEREVLPADVQAREALLMGLRLAEGIEASSFHQKTGVPLKTCLCPQSLETLQAAGYIRWTEDVLQATPAGRQRLNGVLERLIHI